MRLKVSIVSFLLSSSGFSADLAEGVRFRILENPNCKACRAVGANFGDLDLSYVSFEAAVTEQ